MPADTTHLRNRTSAWCAILLLSLVPLTEAAGCVDSGEVPATTSAVENSERISVGASTEQVWRNFSLTKKHCRVTHLVVMVHGRSRNADGTFVYGARAAQMVGRLETTLVVSPVFREQDDARGPTDLYWNRDAGPDRLTDWAWGGNSAGPTVVSSFHVVDTLLRAILGSGNFPNIRSVVIAGHSGGGQFAQRYAIAGDDLGLPQRVSYVVANPSTYAYLDARRPVAGSLTTFSVPTASGCSSSFNDWGYGLDEKNAYVGRWTSEQLRSRYTSRRVTYLLGDADTLTAELDVGCSARLQGAHRYDRGIAYSNHIRSFYPAAPHARSVVPGVGHSSRGMYQSTQGLAALFPPEVPAGNAAPTLTSPAAATLGAAGTSATLRVRATDDAGESALTYTWSRVSGPATVGFSPAAGNAAKDAVAAFVAAGTYVMRVTVRDAAGASVSSDVTLAVPQRTTSLAVTPAGSLVPPNGSTTFVALARDQFGTAMAMQPVCTWQATAGGTMTGATFTAGAATGGPWIVTATAAGGPSATASIGVATISPAVGQGAGGTTVTITGPDLTGIAGIAFGGTAATDVVALGATQVRCVSPARPMGGVVDVSVSLPSLALVSKAAFTYLAPPPAGSGLGITREWWIGIGGTSVASLTGAAAFPDLPSGRDQRALFEAPTNWADSYGTRMRGWITAPVAGAYVFRIAGDDNAQLWLATSGDPAQKALIASVPGWTYPRHWAKYAQQRSAAIVLAAGQRCYIEAMHKEGAGGDHLAVAWEFPNGAIEAPIPGHRLMPFDLVVPSGVGSLRRPGRDIVAVVGRSP